MTQAVDRSESGAPKKEQRAGQLRSSRELFVLSDVRGLLFFALLLVPLCEVQA